MSISIVSFSVVSLIAIVPDSECRMPTLIVSCACALPAAAETRAATAAMSFSFSFLIILRAKKIRRPGSDLDLHAEEELVRVRAAVAGRVRVAARVVGVESRVVPSDHEVHADRGQAAVELAGRLVLRVAHVRLIANRTPRCRAGDRRTSRSTRRRRTGRSTWDPRAPQASARRRTSCIPLRT